MSSLYQLPRKSLIWIVASLISVVLPHLLRMPIWLLGLCTGSVILRFFIAQGRVSYPGSKVKTIIVISTVFLAIMQYGRDVFSTDATVGILIVGIALKLLEMHTRRDAILVIFLCYFAGVAEFIYSQSIPIAIYMFFSVVIISSALMSLNQSHDYQKPKRTFLLSLQILSQSIPLMLALFILFPRISPLWSVPLQTNSGVSGLSDTMSPGDIGELTNSAEIAFKVQFNGEIPDNNLLYWRGITLDLFNGKQWSRRRGRFNPNVQSLDNNPSVFRDWYSELEFNQQPITYNVILEPSRQNWLFTLKLPQIRKEGLVMTESYQLESITPVNQRLSYEVTSWLEHQTGDRLSPGVLRRALSLPDEGNDDSQLFAQQLRAQFDNNLDYANAVLDYFREEEFYYTTSPLILGDDFVDEFFFGSREGFCEHYSSAFTFLMRAAGVPARVVTGYQGGEVNPYDNTLIVRQYDAHAWSEIWIEDRGWVRVDPTAAVAPQRISLGSELALQQEEGFLSEAGFSHFLFRNNLFLNQIRYRIEALDYAWNRWVLNYDQNTQFELFSKFFGKATKENILISVFGVMLLSIAILSWLVLRGNKVPGRLQETEYYLKFCKLMAKYGYPRRVGEVPSSYEERLIKENPKLKEPINKVTQIYMDLVYSPEPSMSENGKKDKLLQLKRTIRQLKYRH